MLSDNLTTFIANKMKETDYDAFVEYGAGNSTRFFLNHLLQLKKKCLFITVEYNHSWFVETIKAIQSDLKHISISEEKLQLDPWTYGKCKRYLHGKNATSLDLPPDLRRLPAAKKSFGGPLNTKMLSYRLKKNNRPLDGCYAVTIEGCLEFMLFLKSEFMKDQYGESPIKREYIEVGLDPIRRKLFQGEVVNAAFFIDGGPRGDIVNSILDLEEANGEFGATIFLCDAYRLYYAGSISRRSSGIFIKGSNRTLNGEAVYKRNNFGKKAQFWHGKLEVSPAELAEKELWFYQSK
jgi:hypothetical protein